MAKDRETFRWMVSSKSFIKLIGGEYELLKKAGNRVLAKFYFSAVCIVVILLASFFSIRYAVELLFHNRFVEIFLSLFLSVLFVFIYVFLINTFTKQTVEPTNRFLNLSNIVRTGFVVFIAFLISKPLGIYFNEGSLDKRVQSYRNELVGNFSRKVADLYAPDLRKLNEEKMFKEAQVRDFKAVHYLGDIESLGKKVDSINTKIQSAVQNADRKIGRSSFFIYRIQVRSRQPLVWLFSTFMVFVFLLPGFIIYSISADDEYFRLKSAFERRLISDGFNIFKAKYSSMFDEKFDKYVEFYSVFWDPPFNTKRRLNDHFKEEKEFIRRFSIQPNEF